MGLRARFTVRHGTRIALGHGRGLLWGSVRYFSVGHRAKFVVGPGQGLWGEVSCCSGSS